MTIRFDITEYENAHGKAPRGKGQWAFSTCRLAGWRFYSENVSYSEAKKAALKALKVYAGVDTIYVLG